MGNIALEMASNKEKSENWDLVIRPAGSAVTLNFKDIWKYRDLLFMFVKRDYVSVYKQTILGPLWFFIQPVLTTLTFALVFGRIARLSTDGLPMLAFYLCGIVAWNYFADCLNTTSGTFINNANIFGKVYFPRIIIPVSVVISNLMKFALQFLLLIMLVCYYAFFTEQQVQPNWLIVFTPLLLLIMGVMGLGFGIIISSYTTKYRDLKFLVTFGVQLFMYATPVAYPLSALPEKYQNILKWNPVTPIVECFRYAFLGKGTFDIFMLLYAALFSTVLLMCGMVVFNKVEKNFMDTV